MKTFWLFKKLDLGLRTEVIINISFLMLAAILLIGVTISEVNEKYIKEEKIRYGERMIQDFQTLFDFMSRDKKEFPLDDPLIQNEVREFAQIYSREKGFYELQIVDHQLKIIASKKPEWLKRPSNNPLMKKTTQTGELSIDLEKSGTFLSTYYKRMTIYSPLWHQGKIVGGIHLEVPIGDLMTNLLESKKIILITIVFDALVLIIFGSFLLSRVLVKPIKDLVRLTQKISDGDFSQKIEGSSSNEIGQLIGSFNRMIERLKENQESLEKPLVLLLLLFTANLTICTLERFPGVWKAVNAPLRQLDEDGFKVLPYKKEIAVKGGADKAEAAVLKALGSKRYRPLVTKEQGATQIASQKGAYTRLGYIVTHISIILIFVGALMGAFYGFKAFLNMPEGEANAFVYLRNEPLWDKIMDGLGVSKSPVVHDPRGGVPAMPLGFYVRCDDFEVV